MINLLEKKVTNPIPENEMERLLELSNLDLDYTDLEESLSDLTKLAAKIAGTEISLVNLIDTYTQWTVSSFGIEIAQMPREESICQYVIQGPQVNELEIDDLAEDERFKDKFYVASDPNLRYYYGIPLKLNDEVSLGALCVLDTHYKEISPEKKEMLSIIAKEVVNRLKIYKAVEGLQNRVHETQQVKNKVAHDIRGPIGGIIGLAEIIHAQGDDNKLEEVLEFINLIRKSGKSLLELADEILTQDYEVSKGRKKVAPAEGEFTLNTVKDKIKTMFDPQALVKQIQFEIEVDAPNAEVPIPKNKILQILGNLVSNSMKFTPYGGEIQVKLDLLINDVERKLIFEVIDSGAGMEEDKIQEILSGNSTSTDGSLGEKGYGFGLNLVFHLVKSLKGKVELESKSGFGTSFKVEIPLK
ncbi:GAF domain-containing sensor histidine kinase [Algoriphagus yeomjeoni]|uniref:histidine kinase n=1 Tax=Algoriphagus yeomjeoni TaxID=291403 RepID=A0A327PMB0_9BACT|nr:GAF domain-containing sensor histidine kinase [Algoriphagus yeomjeoni]RAI92292.1 histidine kinase/DNA gyrase B/HSP90-like ATPase [Algoriphagus yeomjeoni]